MQLTKKLILEDLLDDNTLEIPASEAETSETDDEPSLTPEEQSNFEVGTVSDLLNKYIDVFTNIKGVTCFPEMSETLRNILLSVSEDTAIIIGKLQEALKVGSSDEEEGLINQGQEAAQDIIIDEKEE